MPFVGHELSLWRTRTLCWSMVATAVTHSPGSQIGIGVDHGRKSVPLVLRIAQSAFRGYDWLNMRFLACKEISLQ